MHVHHQTPRWGHKLLVVSVLLTLLMAMGLSPAYAASQSAPSGQRLRNLAGSFLIGYASINNFGSISDAAQYQETARTEFNFMTPENAMKFDAIHPSQNTYNFPPADQHVQFALANNMKVHGHTLVWHSQLPSWVSNGSWNETSLTNMMYSHIDTVMNHYDGQIYVWDVVNEAFNEDGSYRTSLWYNTIGQKYIELAFRRASAADPAAKLIYNDYNIETMNSKSNATYNMLADFKARGVPIHGVGFQTHLAGAMDYQSFASNMQRFANLGLEIYITEMDVRYPTPISQANLTAQATVYRNVIDRCLAQPACKALQVWGIPDKYSWIPDIFPGQGDALIFDNNYQAKPAYYALQAALGGTTVTPTTVTPTTVTPTTVTPTTVTPTTPVPPGGCKVDYTANSWNNGFTADIKITNNSSSAINGWTLTYSYANGQQITSSWNATVSQSGANVTASNPSSHWNGKIAANGGSVSFGVQGTHSGTNQAPTSFALNGATCGGTVTVTPTTVTPTTVTPTTVTPTTVTPTTVTPTTVTPTTVTPTTVTPTTVTPTTVTPTTPVPGTCQVAYTANSWGNGFTADIKITNNSSSAIQGWTLTYSYANGQQITSSWNATVSQSGANVTASNPTSHWNGNIPANGGSVSFGFQGTHGGTNTTPTSFTLNGTACNGGTATVTPTTVTPTNVTPTTVTPTSVTPTPTGVVFRVDADGNITKNGEIIRVKGGSWFGLQGRYEPASDSANPRGAPMEQYMGNVFWAPSGRTYDQDIAEFKAMGINVIRIPLVHQTLDPTDPQGMNFLKNDPSVRIANSRLALETIIKKLDAAGIYVLLDIHSCSNYVDWRKGRLDARPPYVDATRDNYDFKREDSSCAATDNPSTVTRIQAYNETIWLEDLRTLAGFEASLGVSNIIGIDIFNEPWDYTWTEWKTLSEHAYTAINAVNPNTLIFVQGISASAGNQDGTPDTTTQSPHGSSSIIPNWGENLYEAGTNPPNIPKDRLVFSPHAYGPSVFVGAQFADPAQPQCAGLEADEFGDAQCNIVINPTLLEQGWEEHFGYLKAMGYAVVVGEWGGNPDWPGGASSLRDQNRFGYLADKTVDLQWQTAFVNYLLKKGITDTIYWSINPESGDTGGIYTTPYRAGTNESAWGTWGALDTRKMNLLLQLWNAD